MTMSPLEKEVADQVLRLLLADQRVVRSLKVNQRKAVVARFPDLSLPNPDQPAEEEPQLARYPAAQCWMFETEEEAESASQMLRSEIDGAKMAVKVFVNDALWNDPFVIVLSESGHFSFELLAPAKFTPSTGNSNGILEFDINMGSRELSESFKLPMTSEPTMVDAWGQKVWQYCAL